MTGLELTLLLAFIAAVAIAVWALYKWSHFEQWYHTNDNWWEAMMSATDEEIKLWHFRYVNALNAAWDLDKQVSDGFYDSYRNMLHARDKQIDDMALVAKEMQSAIETCLSIIEDADADIAMLHTNMTEMFMEQQALQFERNGAYTELTSLKSNHILTPICHKCHRYMPKDSVLLDGVYTCAKCVEPTPQDLTDAPFEGLEGVKVGDHVLFSDGMVRKVFKIAREPKPEPFKVGDWVEVKFQTSGNIIHAIIVDIPNSVHYTHHVRVANGMSGYVGCMEYEIVRKLSPSEVILDFGNGIKGAIEYGTDDDDSILHDVVSVFNNDGFCVAAFDIASLTDPMRSTVEKLLAAIVVEEK